LGTEKIEQLLKNYEMGNYIKSRVPYSDMGKVVLEFMKPHWEGRTQYVVMKVDGGRFHNKVLAYSVNGERGDIGTFIAYGEKEMRVMVDEYFLDSVYAQTGFNIALNLKLS
jgi:hypothetical protein